MCIHTCAVAKKLGKVDEMVHQWNENAKCPDPYVLVQDQLMAGAGKKENQKRKGAVRHPERSSQPLERVKAKPKDACAGKINFLRFPSFSATNLK